MFDELLREINRLDGKVIKVPLPSDAKGYFDRACPSVSCGFEYKIHEDDWAEKVEDEVVFCPFCRHEDEAENWLTETQKDHIEKVGHQHADNVISGAMTHDAKKCNRRQPKNSFIRMTMNVNSKPTHFVLPPCVAEPMVLNISCLNCDCRYAVIGAAYFCPACGHNSVEQDFTRSLETILKSLSALQLINEAIEDKDTAQNIIRFFIENGLMSAVTAYQRYAEFLYGQHPDAPAARRNAFQSLQEGSRLWQPAYGNNFESHIGKLEFEILNKYFQQRHLLTHKDGIVDDDYVKRSGDKVYSPRQRIVVKKENVRECVGLIQELVKALEIDFQAK